MKKNEIQSFDEVLALTNQALRDKGESVLNEEEAADLLLSYTSFAYQVDKVIKGNTDFTAFAATIIQQSESNITKGVWSPDDFKNTVVQEVATNIIRQKDIKDAIPNPFLKMFYPPEMAQGLGFGQG